MHFSFSWLVQVLVPIFLPLVTGFLTTGSMQWLKKISDFIDSLPATIKPLVVFALSTAITIAAKAAGVALNVTDLGALSSTDVQAVLGGLVAIALHHSVKSAQVQATVGIPPTYPVGQKNLPGTMPEAAAAPSTPSTAPVYGSKSNPPSGTI